MENKTYKTLKKALFLAIFSVFIPSLTLGANLSISPASATYSVGERVVIRVIVSSDVSTNATAGLVSFQNNLFSVESVSKTGSVINYWVTEPSISNTNGVVKFEGVATTPFTGNNSTILSIVLRPLKEGIATVSFKSGQILANDGEGTDITGDLNKAVYTIVPAKVPIKPEATTTPEIPVKKDLNAPFIKLGKQDGLPAVLGTSEFSRSDVVLTFISEGGSKIYITGITDDVGSFSLIVPQVLRSGSYSVSALIVIKSGERTIPSNTIIVQVGVYIYWVIFFLFLLLLLIILYLLWRRYFANKKIHKIIKKEAGEAEDALHKSMKDIREDVYASISGSAGSQINNDAVIKLKKDLDSAEENVDKEIKDIESI